MNAIRVTTRALALASFLVASQAAAADVSFYSFNKGFYSFSSNDDMFLGVADFYGSYYVMAYDARNPSQCEPYFMYSPSIGFHLDGLASDATVRLDNGSDYLTVIGNATFSYDVGGAGADFCANLAPLSNLAYNGYALKVMAGSGSDIVDSGNGADVLYGNGNNDYLHSYGSSLDSLSGGSGNDFVFSTDASAVLVGDSGSDRLWSVAGAWDNHQGNGGSDCIADNQASTFDCGTDQDGYWYISDYSTTPPPGPNASTCEQRVSWVDCVNW